MKVQELRIGNYLTFGQNEDIIETIIAINHTDWFAEGKKYWLETNHCEGELLENFKPIPLTEKLLKDFGFKIDNDIPTFLTKSGITFNTQNMECNYRGQILRKVLYVHQLQNLYFDLTGEELTLNI